MTSLKACVAATKLSVWIGLRLKIFRSPQRSIRTLKQEADPCMK